MVNYLHLKTNGMKQKKNLKKLQKDGALLKEEVDAEEIAEVVSSWTGIPVSKLMEGEMEKLLHLEGLPAQAGCWSG